MGMRQTAVGALLLIGLSTSAEPQVEDSFQISVNVNLVVLNPTVRDRNGRFVSDLNDQNFDRLRRRCPAIHPGVPARRCPGYRGAGCRPQRKHGAEALPT